MAFCTPAVIEKEHTRFHRSGVFDLISDADDEGSEDQPQDGAYVYNGIVRHRKMRWAFVHQDEIPDIVDKLASGGWALEGELSLSPIIQGGEYFTVTANAIKGEPV